MISDIIEKITDRSEILSMAMSMLINNKEALSVMKEQLRILDAILPHLQAESDLQAEMLEALKECEFYVKTGYMPNPDKNIFLLLDRLIKKAEGK